MIPSGTPITSRERVLTALSHRQPDRVPVDFLATPEVWHKLAGASQAKELDPATTFFDPSWEQVLQRFQVDCRLLSYDMFCCPPESALERGATIDWWHAASRSTPNRMWRQRSPEGALRDIWGHQLGLVENEMGSYEEFASFPLQSATCIQDLQSFRWPDPDWWDFTPLPLVLRQLDAGGENHIRFRIGSVFELAWQLRGLQEFLEDLMASPEIPLYIMDRLTEVHVENLKRVLRIAGDRLDMVYFYDDVATQRSLMISKQMWRDFVRPHHARLVEVARDYNKPVMYHCDGALRPLIPELIDLGVTLLNPIQPDSPGMECRGLKADFGNRLSFHGGIDIIETLPRGTPADVVREVRERIEVLGEGGGYVLCSSHHIQPDTPVENIEAMYQPQIR